MAENKKAIIVGIFSIIAFIIIIFGATYALFTYTKTIGTQSMVTAEVDFSFTSTTLNVSNDFPQDADLSNTDLIAMKTTHSGTLSITGHNTLDNGIKYSIYVVKGDDINNKIRLDSSSIKFQLTPNFTSGANGFTIIENRYANPTNLTVGNVGKYLVSTGLIKGTSQSTTVTYDFSMWLDADAMHVSSTMKRATLAEGNPSLADTTSGNVTSSRYLKNNDVLTNNVTLFPASSNEEGKIVYTTNEFSNGYYNIKFVVETEAVRESISVHLNSNGGSISNEYIDVIPGDKYPVLPVPTRSGYTFLGWNRKNKYNFGESSDYWTNTNITIDSSNKTISVLKHDSYGSDYLRNDSNIYSPGTYTFSANFTGTEPRHIIYTYDANDNIIDDTDLDISGFIWNIYYNGWVAFENNITATIPSTVAYWKYGTSFNGAKDSYGEIANIQIEEGATATYYEPYFIDNTVTVKETSNHELTAIWQENS